MKINFINIKFKNIIFLFYFLIFLNNYFNFTSDLNIIDVDKKSNGILYDDVENLKNNFLLNVDKVFLYYNNFFKTIDKCYNKYGSFTKQSFSINIQNIYKLFFEINNTIQLMAITLTNQLLTHRLNKQEFEEVYYLLQQQNKIFDFDKSFKENKIFTDLSSFCLNFIKLKFDIINEVQTNPQLSNIKKNQQNLILIKFLEKITTYIPKINSELVALDNLIDNDSEYLEKDKNIDTRSNVKKMVIKNLKKSLNDKNIIKKLRELEGLIQKDKKNFLILNDFLIKFKKLKRLQQQNEIIQLNPLENQVQLNQQQKEIIEDLREENPDKNEEDHQNKNNKNNSFIEESKEKELIQKDEDKNNQQQKEIIEDLREEKSDKNEEDHQNKNNKNNSFIEESKEKELIQKDEDENNQQQNQHVIPKEIQSKLFYFNVINMGIIIFINVLLIYFLFFKSSTKKLKKKIKKQIKIKKKTIKSSKKK